MWLKNLKTFAFWIIVWVIYSHYSMDQAPEWVNGLLAIWTLFALYGHRAKWSASGEKDAA